MKLDTNICQGKPPSLEEGPMRCDRINENSDSNGVKRINSCNRYIQFVKVILYLELILFIGWLGSILLTSYYWNHRYDSDNGPYDTPEWIQDHYSQDSIIKSDSIRVEDIEWPRRGDDTKAAIEKSKSYTEKVIEGKNDFFKFETPTTTTPSVIETDDMDMYESMVLSRWLEMLKRPRNNWDKSSSKLESFWSRMMTSVEEQNDKFDKSSREKMTLNEDSDTASATQNYFGMIDNENYELSDIDIVDLLPFWQDLSWTLNFTDKITDSDKDSIQDNHFTNFRFDFELPDLVERHLSRQARMATEQNENSSSLSSKETNSPVLNVKHSTDSSSSSSSEETKTLTPKEKRSTERSSSSSSEETNGPAAIAKRSAESSSSSSSEETKAPAPKEKRSAESSSSSSSEETNSPAAKEKRSTESSSSSSSEETKTPAPKEKRSVESSSSSSSEETNSPAAREKRSAESSSSSSSEETKTSALKEKRSTESSSSSSSEETKTPAPKEVRSAESSSSSSSEETNSPAAREKRSAESSSSSSSEETKTSALKEKRSTESSSSSSSEETKTPAPKEVRSAESSSSSSSEETNSPAAREKRSAESSSSSSSEETKTPAAKEKRSTESSSSSSSEETKTSAPKEVRSAESSSSSSSEEMKDSAAIAKRSAESSSSSSSEETNSPVAIVKRSAESSSSSSSEETNGPVAIAKHSAESSSSEETKTLASKVKRSTDSSSSESDSSSSSSDESSSSNSLSNVNDRITKKSIKEKTSCPKIIDDNGNTIDEPKDIVNHIKGNWFKWLLKTPVPDCDQPTSLKTVTLNECGKFVIKCTLDEGDKTSGKSKESVSNHHVTRTVGEADVDRETCERLVEVTGMIFEGIKTDVVLEELCRPMVQDFGGYVVGAVVKAIFELLIGENATESMGSQNLETTRRFQKMFDELKASMATVYTNCSDVPTKSNEFGEAFNATTMAKEQENTLINFMRMQVKVDSLAAEIVTGDSSNVTVIELREKFKSMIGSLATSLASLEPRDPAVISTAPINITDEQWRTHMLELKQEIAKATEEPAIRQKLEVSGSPTQEQTNRLRKIVEYYLSERKTFCHRKILFEFGHPLGAETKMKLAPAVVNRRKRSASLKWEPKNVEASEIYESKHYSRDKPLISADQEPKPIVFEYSVEEDDVRLHKERKARFEGWTNEKAGDRMDPQSIKSLLDTIDVEVSAENPAEIPINKVPSDYTDILLMANHLVANSSSDLRREAYELLRDVVLELQKLDNNNTAWEGYDMMSLRENYKDCLIHMPDTITPEFIFMVIIKAGEAVNLRYSELVDGKKCGDPYKPVYGSFTYTGEEPEKLGVRNWRHIINGIIKLYFKILDPKVHPGLKGDPSDVESQTGSPEIGKSKSIVKRSIGYPIQRYDNSVNVDDKVFADRDDSGSLITMNLDVDAEQRNFAMSQEVFFDKMETLSSHIDRLHELYMRFNELNDDYVSREFPVESPLNYGFWYNSKEKHADDDDDRAR